MHRAKDLRSVVLRLRTRIGLRCAAASPDDGNRLQSRARELLRRGGGERLDTLRSRGEWPASRERRMTAAQKQQDRTEDHEDCAASIPESGSGSTKVFEQRSHVRPSSSRRAAISVVRFRMATARRTWPVPAQPGTGHPPNVDDGNVRPVTDLSAMSFLRFVSRESSSPAFVQRLVGAPTQRLRVRAGARGLECGAGSKIELGRSGCASEPSTRGSRSTARGGAYSLVAVRPRSAKRPVPSLQSSTPRAPLHARTSKTRARYAVSRADRSMAQRRSASTFRIARSSRALSMRRARSLERGHPEFPISPSA